MAVIEINNRTYSTYDGFPKVGDSLPDGSAVDSQFRDALLSRFSNKIMLLNIFPSVDTPTCSASVKKFNELAIKLPNLNVVCVSADLPFANKRFCESFNLDNVYLLSTFRGDLGKLLGVEISQGPMRGLMSRAALVVDTLGVVRYSEHVRDLLNTPVNYDEVVKILTKLTQV